VIVPEVSNAGKDRIGLCMDCKHMRPIRSDRGSTFFLCGRSATEPDFPKYPRLPVLQCSGYEKIPGGRLCWESCRRLHASRPGEASSAD